MKKLLLLLLCLPILTLAQQTYVPDDGFEQTLINLGYDIVLDDYVTTANINTVTFLEVNAMVLDATGLEDFVSLTQLQMWQCCVASLDLSQNINLTSFWLDSTSCLQTLNLKNGNNLNMTINIWGAYNLQCVNVDDVVWANNNWASSISSSPYAFFSEDCDRGRVEGYVYFDADSSTTFGVSEAGLPNQVLELTDGNGITQYVNTDINGFFREAIDSALSFTLSYYPLSNFYETSNNVSHTFQNIAYDSVLTDLNFGVLSDDYVDVSISITKSFTLCNDTATIWIDVTNHGGTDIDGSFEVWVDNQTPIIATSGSPVITSNHIEWSFTGLQPLQHIQQTINVIIPATPGVILIDSARVTPIISPPLYELDTFNNFEAISNMVLCSMDPNDKKVQPEQCYYKSDEIMDYTIRFQNTGNYPAQKVRIIDTLDYNVLDVLSFQVVGASHDYTWTFKGSSVLEVIFDDIQLVDTSVSDIESQGFFKYQIQFKDNITALSKSEMSAYIYFDYNQPVITNKPLAVYSENFNAIITHSPPNLEVQIIDGASPFTYLWSTNDSTQNINIQSTGIHWAIITDANGCELDTLMYNVTGVAGCTDPLACNYDSLANIDDGSCILPDGCTDPLACNYDSTALCDDGSCILPDGCTDPLACNYDSTALCDDGSCVSLPDGCTDPLACNYDSTALCDDGSCILPDGCTDPLACNYDSTALCDDGSCVYPVIWQQAYNICDGDNVVVGSSVYDTTGVYTDTLNASNGCDSIVYTNLTVFQHTIDSITRNICDGESIVVGNSVYNTTGNYTDSLASIHGCDSIIYTNLVVNQHTSSYDTLSLNPFPLSATVVWNGLILNTSGDTSVVLTNSVGCDSVAHFNLTVTHPSTGILNINNTEKTLLKITDLLGRETKGKKNQPLFYIYNDGTVEKRIVIE